MVQQLCNIISDQCGNNITLEYVRQLFKYMPSFLKQYPTCTVENLCDMDTSSPKVSWLSRCTAEPLLKDTLNKGHHTFNLSIKDKFCGPYRTMAIRTTSL